MQKYECLQEDWSIKEELQHTVIEEVSFQVLMNMNEGVILFNQTGKILLYNSAANKLLQIDTTDYIIENVEDISPNDTLRVFKEQKMSLGTEKKLTEEFTFHNREGNLLSCKCDLILLENNSICLMIIRDTKRIPTLLPISYKGVFENASHGLVLSDRNGKVLDLNRVACSIFEMPKIKALEEISMYDFLKENYNGFQKEQNREKYVGHILSFTTKLRDQHYEVHKITEIVKGVDMTVITDITEMVNEINKNDTLKVVGQLAAGIAHEIRNPMTALKGFIQLLQSSIKEDHSMYFGVIMSELQRIETIMTEFLMLAKPKISSYEFVSLPSVLNETVELMQPQATLCDIKLSVKLADKGSVVYGDKNRLKQVFINMLKNAIEATTGGGEVTLSYNEGNGIQHIAIQDTGCGISQDRLERLNQPFYTTKENGTGLGLVVTYKIIEEHDGKIEVESELGEGTVFNLYFPAREAEDVDSTNNGNADWNFTN